MRLQSPICRIGVNVAGVSCAWLLFAACIPAGAQVQPGTPANRPSQWGPATAPPPAQGLHHPIKARRTSAGHPSTERPAASSTPPAAASEPIAAPNLLNQPAQPADIKLEPGRLVINAQNASLSQILQNLSSTTGMKLDGFSQDQRVFGTYGPGEPRDVLTALLESTGYNVLMVGNSTNGVPRQLSLTQRPTGPAQASGGNSQPVSQDQSQDDDADQGEVQPEPEAPPPPPNTMPVPPDGQPTPNGVRTPQQLLEQLQRMHQAQPPQ